MKNNLQFLKQRAVFFVLLCTFCAATRAIAQDYSIKGKIIDQETNTPVANATVQVKGTSKGTTTDSTGAFTISGLSSNAATLQVTHLGFQPFEVAATAGDGVAISLPKNLREIEGVDIAGSKRNVLKDPTLTPLSLQSSVQTVSMIDARQTGAVSVIEALKYTTAGNLSEQGRKRRNLYTLRGLSPDYAIDGVSLYSFQDAPNALSVNMIDQMEITRSSNALLIGYTGLSGVINFKTKTFDKFTTLAEADYGTFKKIHANVTHGGSIKGLKYVVSATKDKMDGPPNRNGAEDMLNLYGKLQYTYKDKLELSAQHFYMNGMREFAQMQDDVVKVAATNKAMIWKFDPLRFNVTIAKAKFFEGKRASTELQFYNIDSRRDYWARAYYVKSTKNPSNPKKPIQTLTDSIPPVASAVNESDKVIGGGLFQTLSFVDNNFLRVAIVGSKKTIPNTQTNPNGTYTNIDIRSFGATVIDEHAFGKLSVNAGVKLMRDYYKRYAPGSTSVYVTDQWQPITTTANAGASYLLTPTMVVNCIVADGQITAPLRMTAITINAPKDTSKFTPKNENRVNVDFGMVKKFKSIGDITLTAFYSNRKNSLKYSGILYTDAGVQREYAYNIDMQTYGVEALFTSAQYFGFLSTTISGTLMRSKGAGLRDSTLPERLFNAGVYLSKFGVTFGVNTKYVSKFYANRFVDIVNTPAYLLHGGDYWNVDLSLAYKIPKTPVTIYGRVTNLADVKFISNTPVYPDYGRQYSAGLKAMF